MGSSEKNIHVESHLEHFLDEHKTSPKDRLIVGVSGGLDSMTLLHSLKKLKQKITAVHVNYGLRGVESDDDEQLIRDYCGLHKISLEVLNAAELIKSKGKDSIQMKAREIRRSFFLDVLNKKKASYILLAHHWDDQVETFFIQLYRNQGIFSLPGMKEREGVWLRPFLHLRKEDLLLYANENKLFWREDSSNLKNDYLRNQIRNMLLPEISKIMSSSKHKAFDSIRRLNNDRLVYLELLNRFEKKNVIKSESGLKIKKSALLEFPNPASLLDFIFREFGVSYALIEEICKNLTNSEHKVYQTKQVKVTIDRDFLSVYQLVTDSSSLEIDVTPSLKIQRIEAFDYNQLNFNRFEAILDEEKIEGELILRKWEKADRFKPLGMKGSKLLSDFFTDKKYSQEEKEAQWLLCDKNSIVWVVNQRVSASHAVSKQTKRAIKVSCIS